MSQTPAVITNVREVTTADVDALAAGHTLRVTRPHNGSSWFEPGTLSLTTGSAADSHLDLTYHSDFGTSRRLPRGERVGIEEVLSTVVKVIDEAGDGTVPMVPTFGTYATLALLLEDVDSHEAMTRLTRALEGEFGAQAVRTLRSKVRPTPDIRVDVTQAGEDGTEIVRAVNVLADEATYLVPMPHTVRLHATADDSVIVGR